MGFGQIFNIGQAKSSGLIHKISLFSFHKIKNRRRMLIAFYHHTV
ncbi:hypothetical protein [Moraxella lacunata]